MRKMLSICFLIVILITSLITQSQNIENRSERLKIFIDCSSTYCDEIFIKTEITIIDFLLDRIAADVHILITSQQTGSGGNRYQMIFYGQNRFSSLTDTLWYNVAANATAVELRDIQLKYLKLGLIPFISKTGVTEGLSINMKQDISSIPLNIKDSLQRDPWNYWVLSVSANGSINADKVYKSFPYNGNFSANRITEDSKIGVTVWGSKSKTTYAYQNGNITETFVAKNSDYGIDHYIAKSITDHWSAGYEFIYNNSTFSNYKKQLYCRAAIEYNIFPYKEVNNRYFTFSYSIISRFNRYYDTTIYNKLKETLLAHMFEVNLALHKKWGTINSVLRYSNFLHDWKLNNLGLNVNLNFRITGGLSLNMYLSAALVHDQVYLPKAGATQQEILTRIRILESSYNFQSGFGIVYRFGSKLNNFVNARFGR